MTTETKVEAVAWRLIRYGKERGFWYDPKVNGLPPPAERLADQFSVEFAYPQSAIDALRGEIERLRSHSERLSHELSEMAQVCGEAYQVVGILLDETEQFGSNHGDKILTNLWEGKLIHKDVIPWSFKGNRHG